MNQHISGQLISGEFHSDTNELVIKQIRNIPVESVWNQKQTEEMYQTLNTIKNSHEDSLIVSVGMLPILLNRQEIEQLHQELQDIITFVRKNQ
ncbi:hypothetical protein [Thermoflavimicrobium dichotomicum]|uniref:Uncharacterized protein n=1 Tax=Thermoflavimicrobium dichotomicum TaxID=46223 RepID=A0A1I3SA31_9BACL|nr:hypothetical protein [Thermoflavimicrobium dichotomicum]SFJ55578.1 hypothetical protein SAMN05421852_11289 [Thermoflavimicrobium dichotomicum]